VSAEQAKLLDLALNRVSGEWDEEILVADVVPLLRQRLCVQQRPSIRLASGYRGSSPLNASLSSVTTCSAARSWDTTWLAPHRLNKKPISCQNIHV